MSFVKDITIGEGESVTPNTKFTKTWRIQNTGWFKFFLLVLVCESTCIYNKLTDHKIFFVSLPAS